MLSDERLEDNAETELAQELASELRPDTLEHSESVLLVADVVEVLASSIAPVQPFGVLPHPSNPDRLDTMLLATVSANGLKLDTPLTDVLFLVFTPKKAARVLSVNDICDDRALAAWLAPDIR